MFSVCHIRLSSTPKLPNELHLPSLSDERLLTRSACLETEDRHKTVLGDIVYASVTCVQFQVVAFAYRILRSTAVDKLKLWRESCDERDVWKIETQDMQIQAGCTARVM